MTESQRNASLGAYALGSAGSLKMVPRTIFGEPLRHVNSDDPVNLLYCLRMNAANNLSYGGLGMPEWVQLDCAMLPAAFFGLEGPALLLGAQQRHVLDWMVATKIKERQDALKLAGFPIDPANIAMKDDDLVPLAEFCALPRLGDPTAVIGYSLFSLDVYPVPGAAKMRGVGSRAKAVGLEAQRQLGATKQIGICQYDNASALKTHTLFGELELLQVLAPFHTKVGRTFIYELAIPGEAKLRAIASPASFDKPPQPKDAPFLDPTDTARLAAMDRAHRAGTHSYKIVPPGVGTNAAGRPCIWIEESTNG